MAYKFPHEQQAILRTILYGDIFSFPLQEDEIVRLLISDKPLSKQIIIHALQKLIAAEVVSFKDTYYCLAGRENIITRRKQHLPEVQKKLQLAQKAANALAFLPTIQCIGLSGGLSVGNVTKKDDIDFFIITKKNTLFTTRLWILCILAKMGLRRTWNAKDATDKICVNLLIDESELAWPSNKRDIYSAREIAQLTPLLDRNATYTRFIHENQWIHQYVPNWHPKKDVVSLSHTPRVWYRHLIAPTFLERLLRWGQQQYMKRHQTTEQVENRVLAFHPNDYRPKILAELRSKCEQLGLLTNF